MNPPGEILAQARESLGVSQREVSEALNLSLDTVIALETGDAERLPAPVFARGYVRAYAKLLELDPEPLVAAMVEASSEPESVGVGPATNATTSGFSIGLPPGLDLQKVLQPRNLAVFAGIVLTLMILLVLLSTGEDPEDIAQDMGTVASDATTVDASSERQNVPGVPDLPIDSTHSEEVKGASSSRSSGSEIGVRSNEMVPAVESSKESSVAEQTPPDERLITVVADAASLPQRQDPARRLTDVGEDRLSLEFTEDCWVDIRDIDEQALFGDLGRATRRWEFVGAAPFKIKLGYAPGVTMTFNGEIVALGPHTRNNVANLILGQ